MTDWETKRGLVCDVLAVIEDHHPRIEVDHYDPIEHTYAPTWLKCECGWDQSIAKEIDWHQHLVNAWDDADADYQQMMDEAAETHP